MRRKTFTLTKLPSPILNNSSVTSGKIPDNSLQDGKFANALEFYLQNLGHILNLLLYRLSFTQKDPTALKLNNYSSSFVQFPE